MADIQICSTKAVNTIIANQLSPITMANKPTSSHIQGIK